MKQEINHESKQGTSMQIEDGRDSILLTEKLPKLFLKFTIPALIAMLITGVQGIIDGIFVGNILGSNSMASINIALPFMQVIIGTSMVISIGSQSYIGMKLGLNSVKEAQDTFQSFFRIITMAGALITISGVLFHDKIARLIGASDVLIQDTATYICILSLFAIPMMLMYYFGFLNRIIGKPEMFFKGSVLSLIVNIALDYLFIAKLDLGIIGAALATGTAYSSALLMVISPMIDGENIINVFKGKFDKKCVGPVLFNGSSEGVTSISIASTIFLFNLMMMRVAGEDGVAAFTTINYIATMGSLVLFGISDGVGPIVSYNYGYGSMERVKRIMKAAYLVNLIIGILIFALLFFGGEALIHIFVKENPEIVSLAIQGGKLYGLAFFFSGFNILNSGYFTFIGCGMKSVLVSATRGVVGVILWIFVLPMFFGTTGVWLSVVFAEICAMILGVYFLKKNE